MIYEKMKLLLFPSAKHSGQEQAFRAQANAALSSATSRVSAMPRAQPLVIAPTERTRLRALVESDEASPIARPASMVLMPGDGAREADSATKLSTPPSRVRHCCQCFEAGRIAGLAGALQSGPQNPNYCYRARGARAPRPPAQDFFHPDCNLNWYSELKMNYRHRELTEEERNNFTELYREVENKNKFFKWVKSSSRNAKWYAGSTLAACLLLIYFGASRGCSEGLQCSDNVLIGFLPSWAFLVAVWLAGLIWLQVVFVMTHTMAHALFLEYDRHSPNHPRPIKHTPVYFYAFYHHHHTVRDNWAPEMGYHSSKSDGVLDHEGTRNVVTSHWCSFTYLFSFTVWSLVCWALIYYDPIWAVFFSGYEFGVLLLPLAHGWQHLPKERIGARLSTLFGALEYVGLFANHKDHNSHHNHKHRTVYQDFSSSGLYVRRIDSLLNRLWNAAFDNGTVTPYIYLRNFFVGSLSASAALSAGLYVLMKV